MAIVPKDDIPFDDVNRLFWYDEKSGNIIRKVAVSNFTKVGEVAGTITKDGYRSILINGRHYLAHRLAWLLSYGNWPNGFLDHIDGDKLNNKISNLRIATKSQNSMNRKLSRSNKSGCRGVYWDNTTGKWCARIKLNYQLYTIGYFEDKEAAIRARKEREALLFGSFNRVA